MYGSAPMTQATPWPWKRTLSVAGRHQPPGHPEGDAGHRPGLAGVDRFGAGVRQRAAQDFHVQHAGKHDVVGVVALAPDETVVLAALAARAEPADLDLVECLRS